jgi:colicin import membrane protein
MTDTFSRNLYISAGAHGVIALLIFVRAIFVPSEPIEIRKAIRVDVVGLPQKITEPIAKLPEPAAEPMKAPPPPEPAKELPAKETPKPPEPKTPTVNLDKKKPAPDTKKAQSKALDKIKQMAALDKIKNDIANDKPAAKPKGGAIAGNVVSAGNSLTGMEKIEYDRYFDEIEGKVHSNFHLPQWLAETPLKAQVQVLIDSRGYVIKKIVRRSSGNDIFDAKVLEAVDASSPFSAPPNRLAGALASGGIMLNFPE